MSTRSLSGFSPIHKKTLFGLGLSLSLGLGIVSMGGADSSAQQDPRPAFNPPGDFSASTVDPVTAAVLGDALLRLRLLSIALLEKDEDVGLAQSGVIRAYLARRNLEQAITNAELIKDPIWRARSFVWISDYISVVEEDRNRAYGWLVRASTDVDPLSAPRDEGETQQLIAIRLARLGFSEEAIDATAQITDPNRRIEALGQVANLILRAFDSQRVRRLTSRVLQESYTVATSLPPNDPRTVPTLMEIGTAQIGSGDLRDAQNTFLYTQQVIELGPPEDRLPLLTKLAAKLVQTGDQRAGMAIVRMIPEGADRARALAAVSSARGVSDLDAAVPLFRLAQQETTRVEDQSDRFDALAFLVTRQAEVGRLRDAFNDAFLITEDVPRAEALLNMGKVMIDQGKLREALILKDYIPFIGMRAQIMSPVALGRGLENDPEGASALLAEALDPTGFPYQTAYIPDALNRVLTTQIRVGLASADQAIFSRARELAEGLPGDLVQVQALIQVAIAEARRGRIDDAQKTISSAYRTAFQNSDEDGFEEALMSISLAQLAVGDLLGAYDTAARIPEPPLGGPYPKTADGQFDIPRYQALIRVAAASGRLGDPVFGQEVTDKIRHEPAKAAGLAAVALAMSNRTEDLIDVINDIQSGAFLSPDFDYLNQALDTADPEPIPEETGPEPDDSAELQPIDQ